MTEKVCYSCPLLDFKFPRFKITSSPVRDSERLDHQVLLALSPVHTSPSHCVTWFFQGGDHLFLRGEWVVSQFFLQWLLLLQLRDWRGGARVAPRRGSSSSSFWHWHLSSQATLCCFLSSLFWKEGGNAFLPVLLGVSAVSSLCLDRDGAKGPLFFYFRLILWLNTAHF
jgi:hypothetical protein